MDQAKILYFVCFILFACKNHSISKFCNAFKFIANFYSRKRGYPLSIKAGTTTVTSRSLLRKRLDGFSVARIGFQSIQLVRLSFVVVFQVKGLHPQVFVSDDFFPPRA